MELHYRLFALCPLYAHGMLFACCNCIAHANLLASHPRTGNWVLRGRINHRVDERSRRLGICAKVAAVRILVAAVRACRVARSAVAAQPGRPEFSATSWPPVRGQTCSRCGLHQYVSRIVCGGEAS